MKREVRALRTKAVDSLVTAVDHFNRAWDRGRVEAVLIMLDRAFELLLKAIIVHRNGSIRDTNRMAITIGFDLCLRKCFSDPTLACLTEDDVIALQSLNALRDAAQHYMIEVCEDQLYVYAQASVTLFRRLAHETLGTPIHKELPFRILPVCARIPKDLASIFEFAQIKRMVGPRSRQRLDARARLRSLAVLQSSLDGQKSQVSDAELDGLINRINRGEDWRTIFKGVATLTVDPDADGPGLRIRITRNQGEAVAIVPEDTPGATVIAVRKVNDLDFYNLGLRDLSKRLRINETKLLWLIQREKMQQDPEYYKVIRIGRTVHKRYSSKCLEQLSAKLSQMDLHGLWTSRNRLRAGHGDIQ
jgi:hypothetical protein